MNDERHQRTTCAVSLLRHHITNGFAISLCLCYHATMKAVPYQFRQPPGRLKKARLDNIALVPASLLPMKGTYQPIANKFPIGSVLCIQGSQRQQRILTQVTRFFRNHGHQVITLPIERITKKIQTSYLRADTLQLAF